MTKTLWLALGYVSVALGVIGVVLPIMPTVPFLILAAFAFAKSSPRLEAKLLADPLYGPHIRNWRDRRAITRRAKWMATLAFAASIGFGALTLAWPWVLIPPAIAVIALLWLWTRPE
jgi:uncharacterized protein